MPSSFFISELFLSAALLQSADRLYFGLSILWMTEETGAFFTLIMYFTFDIINATIFFNGAFQFFQNFFEF